MVKEKRFNPMDSFRKEQKKKEQKKAKEVRDSAREVRNLLNDPAKIDQEIQKVQIQSNENRLDKGLKDRIVELKRMKEIALQKQKIDIANGRRVNITSEPPPSSSSISQNVRPPPPPAHPNPNYQYSTPQHFPYGGTIAGQQNYALYSHQVGHVGMGNPVLMGGMNGIPLPPPRPPSSSQGNPPPQTTHIPQSNRQNQRKRDNRKEGYFDPLDPTASGYTERFGRKNDIARNEGYDMDTTTTTTTTIHATISTGPNTIRANSPNANEQNDDGEDDEDAQIQHRLSMIAASYRKEGTPSNQEISHNSSSTEENHNKRGRESNPEDDTPEVSAKKAKASKPKESSSLILPGMEFYDDDEEEEEIDYDSNNSSEGDDSRDETESGDHAVGPTFPHQGMSSDMYHDNNFPALMDPEEYLLQLQQQQQSMLGQHPSDNIDHGRHCTQVWVEDADDNDDEVETTLAKETTIKAPVQVASVKVDAALTAFKPSSVGRSTVGKKPAFAPKPPSSAPPAPIVSTSTNVNKVVETSAFAPKTSESTSAPDIDDDYSRFMAEIGDL